MAVRFGRARGRHGGATLLACCMALAAAAPVGADSSPAGDFSFQFSSTQPGTPAGLEFRQIYKNPNDPDAKPSPVRRFLFAAPEGSVFDGTAVPACDATDQQFQQMGKAACPAESVVGAGFITIMTGIPGEQPFPADATVFNSGDGIIELFTEQNTGTFVAIERPKFRGANAFEDTDIAPTPGGPPDGQSAAREAYIEFPVSPGSDGRSFITTPPECPTSGRWTARFEWTNADGNSYSNNDDMPCVRTTTVTDPMGPSSPLASAVTTGAIHSTCSTTPCTPAAAKRPDVIHASLRPRRVRAGRRVRIKVRLRSSNARCVANATVRLAGHRPVRTNRAGRATVVQTFHRPGRRTLIVAKRGCASGRATLTILPAT